MENKSVKQKVNVLHASGSYPIYIGSSLLGFRELLSEHIKESHVCIVTNESLATLYLDTCLSALSSFKVDVVVLPDGETYKNFASYNQVLDLLCAKRYQRDCTLLALGGGVIGDITGFVAATYHRGVAYIQVPTTLLAQVDSSIGGKTAINHANGKNLIGAFYQPQAVIVDFDVLTTLPQREFISGLAEIIKAALIADEEFFIWLEQNIDAVLNREQLAIETVIYRACCIKKNIVEGDEREDMQRGTRALLNFGHTFGHAIENILGYKELLHGEAVALGMLIATTLSHRLGMIDLVAVDRVRLLLRHVGYLAKLPAEVLVDNLMQRMQHDKKVYGGCLNLILLEAVGSAVVESNVSPEILKSVLEGF